MPAGPGGPANIVGQQAGVLKILPTRPVMVRTRTYGAPLVAGTRAAAPRLPPLVPSEIKEGSEEKESDPEAVAKQTVTGPSAPITRAPDQDLVTPLIFWDQPPRPESEIDEISMLPDWVDDLRIAPTELQYAELGTYLLFMVDGFSDFCRSQYIIESGQWQGRMHMPRKILPETMLQLDVSAFHAKLRFETDHPVSKEILRRHCVTLRDQVNAALEGSREVEVTVW